MFGQIERRLRCRQWLAFCNLVGDGRQDLLGKIEIVEAYLGADQTSESGIILRVQFKGLLKRRSSLLRPPFRQRRFRHRENFLRTIGDRSDEPLDEILDLAFG